MNPTLVRFVFALGWLTASHVNAVFVPSSKCDNRQFNTSRIFLENIVTPDAWVYKWITDAPVLSPFMAGSMRFSYDNTTQQYMGYKTILLNDGNAGIGTCVVKRVDAGDYFTLECVYSDGQLVNYRMYSLYFIATKAALAFVCVDGDFPEATVDTHTAIIAARGDVLVTDEEVKIMQKVFYEALGATMRSLS